MQRGQQQSQLRGGPATRPHGQHTRKPRPCIRNARRWMPKPCPRNGLAKYPADRGRGWSAPSP
eukprot:1607861-Lingulodinium_polyedra.AAC.1